LNIKKLFLFALVLTTVSLGHSVRADETWNVNYVGFGATSNITGGINVNVTRPSGTFSALAFCVDRFSNVGVPSYTTLQATTNPTTTVFTLSQNGVDWLQRPDAASLWSRVSWIYNSYGMDAGANNSTQAFATQLAIWDVLGELGASPSHGDPALNPYAYGSAISNEYNTIMTTSLGQSGSAFYMARTPDSSGNPGQALITNFAGSFHTNAVTPEGNSLFLICGGCLPFVIVPLRKRLRRQKA